MKRRTVDISPQQLARDKQNYVEKPILKICENCEYYRSTFVESEWGSPEEKHRRCVLGNFAVKRKSSCDTHVFNDLEEQG